MTVADLAGTQLGPSAWIAVTQERIEEFARATADPQWIHVDPDRAGEGPYGGTIAHGFLTLSLVVPMLSELLPPAGGMTIDYGVNRVRFPAPGPEWQQDPRHVPGRGCRRSGRRQPASDRRNGRARRGREARVCGRVTRAHRHLKDRSNHVLREKLCYRPRPVGVVEEGSPMRSMRFTRVLAYVAVAAAIAVPVAISFGFDDGVNPPGGTVGTPYSFQFKGRNGCPPYTFVLKSGAPPPGLSMDSGGTVSGTPTTAGSFLFWVELRDSGCVGGTCPPAGVSCSAPSQRPFTIPIADKLTVQQSALGPATVGVPYSVKFSATGGGDLTWSVSSGVLPAGLTLAADGTLSGTPTAAVDAPVTFVVKVTDGARVDTKSVSLDVVTPVTVTTPTFPAAEIGHALKPTTVVATGGRTTSATPYAWALVGAPSWLTLDPATGQLSGTPDAAGSFPFQVSVKDNYGTTATLSLIVTVKAKVTVKTAKLAVTKVGKLYKATLRAAGGVAPFTWKVTSGKFPVGIRLDRKLGVLGGTSRKAGTFPLQFTVTDSLGETADVSLTLTVNALPKKKKKH